MYMQNCLSKFLINLVTCILQIHKISMTERLLSKIYINIMGQMCTLRNTIMLLPIKFLVIAKIN